MFDLPSSETAKKVVLDASVVNGENDPYIIHETEKKDTKKESIRRTGSS